MILRLCRIALASALLVAFAGAMSSVQAQGLTGQISGTVTDSGGGVLPGATVTSRTPAPTRPARRSPAPTARSCFPTCSPASTTSRVTVNGFKTYEQKGSPSRRPSASALRAIALEVGGVAETVTVQAESVQVQTTTAARSGLITRDNIEDIALKGRDFAGHAQAAAGRRRHDATAKRRAGAAWAACRSTAAASVQLLLRRRHQQGHRLEQRQLRGAGARLDRRSPRPDVELPGRVRPQLGRDDHRRHAQRLEGLPRQRGVLQARRRAERATSSPRGSSAAWA